MIRIVLTAARLLAVVLVAAGTFVLIFIAVQLAAGSAGVSPPELPRPAIPLFVLTSLGVPLAFSAGVILWSRRRGWLPRPNLNPRHGSLLLLALATGYIATALFGAAAVQTHTNSLAVNSYKQLKASSTNLVNDAHPYVATYATIPVAPGVMVTYHEYQLHGRWGSGEFAVFVWYGVGVSEILRLPVWVS